MARHQLPVHSPLSAAAVAAAFGPGDARPQLRETLKRRYGAAQAVLTDSGTSALALALKAASARSSDLPCALPSYACYDLATAALAAGVEVVLYDLDPLTLAPEPASLARALSGGAAALVAVHLYGVPVPMDALRTAAEGAGALLIEDAAQGAGGEWNGRPLGAHGDLSVLSFGRGKGMTGGGGGVLLSRNTESLPPDLEATLAAPGGMGAFALRLAAQWLLGRPTLYGIPASIPALRLGETIYHAPGPLSGMLAASARVLGRTLRLSDEEAVRRRANAKRMLRAADGAGVIAIRPAGGGAAGWLRLPVLLGAGHREHGRDDARLGIMPGYPIPLTDLPELAPARRAQERAPGATRLARDLWTLPTHGRLTEADLLALERWLAQGALLSR